MHLFRERLLRPCCMLPFPNYFFFFYLSRLLTLTRLCSPDGYICIYRYVCVCMCIYIYIYTYTHTHTHTH